MEIEKMNEQQIIEYLRSKSSSSKALGVAKSRTVEDFFVEHNITIRCPKCLSPKKVKNGTNDSGITRYKCKDCGKGYSIVTNTIFEGSSYSVDEVINAVHAVLNGDTTVFMSENTKNTTQSTSVAWLLMHKIRHTLADMPMPHLSGMVQVDEKYIREAQKGSRSLVSYLDPTQSRRARKHNYRSECGIFGPEFVNVLCAVDEHGHYWAKCVCLGPMDCDILDKELRSSLLNVSYLCSDNYGAYSEFCKKHNFKHYVVPSKYLQVRKARGYVDADDIYHTLTQEEYDKNERINQQLYKEKIYPYVENSGRDLSFHELTQIKNKFGLTVNGVNSFHSDIQRLLNAVQGISSEYVADYIGSFVYIKNYKSKNHIRSFNKKDAANVLAEMIEYTIKKKWSPTLADISGQSVDSLPRPSKRTITEARKRMKSARSVIVEPKAHAGDGNAYEGESTDIIFNHSKFFRSIGTTRLNELAKLYGVYDRNETKADRIRRLSDLPEADDIIFNEIAIERYGSVEDMKNAFNKLPEKRKRGRPKKAS